MSLIKVDLSLIDTTSASDGDVLKYVSANSKLEYGEASTDNNTWVNANDYSTYTTVSTLIDTVNANVDALPDSAANDYSTYTTVSTLIDTVNANVDALPDSAANDYSTYTTVSTLIDTVNANVDALPDSAANDYSTYTTVSTLIDTVQSNLTSVIGASPTALDTLAEIAAALENDANIAVTLTNQIGLVSSNVDALPDSAANDYSTYTTVTANTYDTYVTLTGLVDTVQDNVGIVSNNAKFNSSNFWGYYANETELNSNYIHGGFAHVHGTGRAYFGHAGSWVKLAHESEIIEDNNTFVNSNDHVTYTTLTANTYDTYVTLTGLIDTVQDNVSAGSTDNNTFVNSNDHVTYTTLTANDYNTYTTLSSLIDTVQDNVAAGGGSGGSSGASGGIPISDTFTTSSNSNTFSLSESVTSANSLIVSFQGINQVPNEDYVISGSTLTLINTAPITAGLTLEVRHLKLLTVTSTDATISTANGVTTSFTSPFDTNDPNDVIVTVDGLMQRPTTDYSISGTTVTFGSAPPDGTSVMIRHAAVTANYQSSNSQQSSFWLTHSNLTELQANYIPGAFSVVDSEASGYFGYGGSWSKIGKHSDINLIQDNVDSLTSTVDSTNANLYNTYNTVTANTHSTYVTLTSLIDTVQDNVAAGSGGGGSQESWNTISSNITLTSNTNYFIDCANTAITVTLPSPVYGAKIKLIDATGSANTNAITINSGGNKIMGDAGDMTVSTHRAALTLIYFNSDYGWLLGEL